ncbi:MAG: hypothetical protein ND866_25710 [Pyrinomonadaceae bacterium]|nr:hypothetical protein [Pyrinomonadaceae bacterium]
MFENAEVVKVGTFLYDGTVICDIRIVKHNGRYGTGDPFDEPKFREDIEGEFYYIEFGSTVERGKFVSGSQALPSLEAAVREAEDATGGRVTWQRKT